MENNFIQMAAPAGHAVGYMIRPIFMHSIYRVQLYFTNGVNCLWFVGVTLISDGTTQKIVQRCQIVAPR